MRTMKEKAKPHPLRLTKSSDTPPDCLLFHPATNKGSGGVDMALCLPSGSAGCGGKCASRRPLLKLLSHSARQVSGHSL